MENEVLSLAASIFLWLVVCLQAFMLGKTCGREEERKKGDFFRSLHWTLGWQQGYRECMDRMIKPIGGEENEHGD